MTNYNHHEKRELPRLLCSEGFSVGLLIMGYFRDEVSSINFNRNGIGIFVNGRLPDEKHGEISFSYTRGDLSIDIEEIPFTLVYANETEVGGQYGLKFDLDRIAPEILERLQQIETALGQESTNSRYGV